MSIEEIREVIAATLRKIHRVEELLASEQRSNFPWAERRLVELQESLAWFEAELAAALDHQGRCCGARTRKGTPCGAPRVKGKRRCKLHGGRSTGATSPEGRERALAALARGRAVVMARRSSATTSTP